MSRPFSYNDENFTDIALNSKTYKYLCGFYCLKNI